MAIINRQPPHPKWRRFVHAVRHMHDMWIAPIFDCKSAASSIGLYSRYLADWFHYRSLPEAEPLHLRDSYPCLFDSSETTPYDPHYFYQAIWAMERIVGCGAKQHVDLGSDIKFVGMLTTHLPVTFVDFRPLKANLPRLTSVTSTVLALPFANRSLASLSCLHVAEHVGLGRYGDPLEPSGTRRACLELARVLADHGNLFFAVPIGRPRVCFNAHRIHSPRQILDYFEELHLVEFSAVDDQGKLVLNADIKLMGDLAYGCGLFWFRRGP